MQAKVPPLTQAARESTVTYTDPMRQFLEEAREKAGLKREPEPTAEERDEALREFFKSADDQ